MKLCYHPAQRSTLSRANETSPFCDFCASLRPYGFEIGNTHRARRNTRHAAVAAFHLSHSRTRTPLALALTPYGAGVEIARSNGPAIASGMSADCIF